MIPQIEISSRALQEIENMITHDFTLEGLFFRLRIDNKGCDGFTYELGFSEKRPEDIQLHLSPNVPIIMDPFTAKYCAQGSIDFILEDDGEGFIFKNNQQKSYFGKFWNKQNKAST